MTDQCKYCTCRGNIKVCLATHCEMHTSWFGETMIKTREVLERLVKSFEGLKNFNEAQEVLKGKDVKTLTCGCCSRGCCCENHKDVPRGRPAQVCEIHKRK